MRTPLVVPISIGAFFGALSTRLAVGDSDAFWHLRLGEAAIRGYPALPESVSGLSWTAPAWPGSSDQWLGQVLLALAFDGGGWRGVTALRALAVALLVGLIVYLAIRERPDRPLGAVVAAFPAIVLSRFVWTERPELFGFVCFTLLVVLLRAASAGSRGALIALPALLVVWANLHGSFALGAILTAIVFVAGAITEPARRRGYLISLVAVVLATLATPAGVGAWTAPGFHLLHPPRAIQEWAVPDVTTLPGLIFFGAVLATLTTALLVRASQAREGFVLLPVLFISLIATRQTPLFTIAAVPYLAAHGGAAAAELASRLRIHPRGFARVSRPPGRKVDGIALALAGTVLFAMSVTGSAAPDLAGYPVAALPLVRPGPGLFNHYDWGGYLIASAPATPVFVDGRLVPYLGSVLTDYTTVIGTHPGWREVIERRRIRQILVRPADPVAVRARDLGWPIRASSDTFVLIDVP